jgi:hypothetical protein
MNFPITPHDILSLTEDAVAALAASPNSARRAYVCVIMGAHLAEHVAAAKGYDASDYRDQVEQEEPALKLVRDLANYAKHVHISRYSPAASSLSMFDDDGYHSLADAMEDPDEDGWGEAQPMEGFHVQNGSSGPQPLLAVMRSAIYFWREELLRLGLLA